MPRNEVSLGRTEPLPPELARFPKAMHHALRVIASTTSIEHAYLLGAICQILDEPPALLMRHWDECKTSSSAYNRFYRTLQVLDQDAERARFDGAPLGLFSGRVVCLPETNNEIINGNCGDRKMCLVVPGFQRLIESVAPQHRPSYFATAYFYEQNGQITIGSMRAPLWDLLPESVRERYARWPEVLLAAIEQRALKMNEKEPFVTGPDERQRTRRLAERVAINLVVMQGPVVGRYDPNSAKLFAGTQAGIAPINDQCLQAIRAAGYRELPADIFASRVNSLYGELKPEHFLFKYIPLSRSPSSKADETIKLRDCFNAIPNSLSLALAREHRALFPLFALAATATGHVRHSFPTLPLSYTENGGPLEGIERSAAITPVRVEAMGLRTVDFKGLAKYYDRNLQHGLLAEALQRIPRHFIPISAGPRGAARHDWWNLAGEVKAAGEFFHLREQNRHPTLHYTVPNNDGLPQMLCIGFKGAGFLDTDGLPLRRTKFLREADLHSPILHNPRKSGSIHGDWGGLRLMDAQSEFDNLLGINYLMSRVAPRLGLVAAQPLDIANLEAIPVWERSGKVRWMTPEEHSLKVLGQEIWAAVPNFVCLRTVSVSDVRLSQVVNRIFSPPDVEKISPSERKEMIDSAMRYLYRVNGYVFEAPKFPLPLQAGELTSASVAWYLRLAAEANPRASQAIFHRFESKLFVSMAAVHAIGGHLGGFKLPGHDRLALRGGPLTLRNVGADGLMHDVDHYCHLPLSSGWGSTFKREQNIEVAQALDIATFQDSLYWLRIVLGQRESMPSQAVASYRYGPRFSVQRFRDDKDAIEQEIKIVRSSLNPKENNGTDKLVEHMGQCVGPQYAEIRAKVLKVLKREAPILSKKLDSGGTDSAENESPPEN